MTKHIGYNIVWWWAKALPKRDDKWENNCQYYHKTTFYITLGAILPFKSANNIFLGQTLSPENLTLHSKQVVIPFWGVDGPQCVVFLCMLHIE
jgi:hypothetical protein